MAKGSTSTSNIIWEKRSTMSRPTKRTSDNSSSSVPPEESNINCSIPVATSTSEANTNSSTTANSNSYVSTGGPRTLSNTPTAILRSHIPETVDVFGFAIPPGQFILVQLVATLMLGFHGCEYPCSRLTQKRGI